MADSLNAEKARNDVQLLYLSMSPDSMRVQLALAWKGISYDSIEENLAHKSPLLLASNPVYKAVPVLIHGGFAICESSIIIEYIDEVWPNPHRKILPADPYARAVTRFWADYISKKLGNALSGIATKKGEEQKGAIEEAMECLGTLEAEAFKGNGVGDEEGRFLGGAQLGFADIVLGPFAASHGAFEDVGGFKFPFEQKFPRLKAWIQAFKESPIFYCLPDAEGIALDMLFMRVSWDCCFQIPAGVLPQRDHLPRSTNYTRWMTNIFHFFKF